MITVIQTFNNANTIDRAISSVIRYCDRIIVVDGAFADYPHNHPYSTDGTAEIATTYPQVEFVKGVEYATEATKRNVYLEMLSDGDLFLSLDSDEELIELDIDKFKEPYSYLQIYLPNKRVAWQNVPRLIRYRTGMYYQTHYLLKKDLQVFDLTNKQNGEIEPCGTINQLERTFTQEYYDWKETQRQKESPITKELHKKHRFI